ncbi:sugar ABC transporter permease [Spirochaetia bacterium]|nr:sugar ABC transporter permease [Spirochaetia bacterium]
MKRSIKKTLLTPLNLMVIPGMLYLLINNYIPMAGVLIAFKRINYSKGIFLSDWIGLENFKYLFSTRDAFIITRNTLLYNMVFILMSTILGLMVGIFLSEIISRTGKKIYQTLILLPQLFSTIIIAYIVVGFLSNESGFINKTLLGPDNAINFYSAPVYWPFILTIVYLWKGLGYNSIIYFSAVVSVDRNLYEAATVDGVGRFKQIFYVTIPSIKPTIITLFLISVGRIFYSDFGLFYQIPMNSGVLYNVTNTIDTYVYRSLLQLNNIAMASAASAYQALVGFIIIITVNEIIRKLDRDNAMF